MPDPIPNPEDFRTTLWTLVGKAGDPANPAHDAAVEGLLLLYRPALRSHLIRRKRIDPEKADDLLQEFVLKKVLQYNLIGRADRARGKFRTLLLTALDNFVRNTPRKSPGVIDLAERDEPADPNPQPDEAFDVPWARQVIQETLRRMRTDCEQTKRLDLWGVFDARILSPMLDGVEPASYQSLVDRFELESPAQASNVLITGKRMFERNLRAVVSEYAGKDEIETEIADLREILSKARD